MWIQRVEAVAFGPLQDASLDLAPGLTVVVGPNESGKSSWHAATYAALCGRRRGPGAGRRFDRDFRRRHRPWQGTRWSVAAELVLADGRRIRLAQDLDAGVDCRATDLVLGRDVSAEILFEGTPDGSQWLGLDRYSFAATACVNQTELLAVLERAGELQEQLQRAAASARSADATAAQALNALAAFARDQVGRDHATSRRPLRLATAAEQRARQELDQARREHEAYLGLVEQAASCREKAESAAEAAQRAGDRAQAAQALAEHAREVAELGTRAAHADDKSTTARAAATELTQRVDRAQQLHGLLGGVRPPGPDDDSLATTVAAALERWEAAPPEPGPGEDPTADLESRLRALPDPPTGDTSPHPSVEQAATALLLARSESARRAGERAGPPSVPAEVQRAITAGPAALRDLAGRADALPDVGEADAEVAGCKSARDAAHDRQRALAEQVAALDADVARAGADRDAAAHALAAAQGRAALAGGGAARPRQVHLPLALTAAALGAAGAALMATGRPLGLLLILAAAGAGIAAAGRLRGGTHPAAADPAGALAERDRAQQHLDSLRARREVARAEALGAQTALATAQGRLDAAADRLAAARASHSDLAQRCADLGLPADPDHLRGVAARADAAVAAAAERQEAARRAALADAAVADAAAALRSALAGRGAAPPEDGTGAAVAAVDELLRDYRGACRARSEQAAAAAQREPLVQALAGARAEQRSAASARQARAQAARALAGAACALGARADAAATPDEAAALVDQLRTWQRKHSEQQAAASRARQQWAELQALLNGASLADLTRRAQAAAEAAATAEAAAAAARRVQQQAAADLGEQARLLSAHLPGMDGMEGPSTADGASPADDATVAAAERLRDEARAAHDTCSARARDLAGSAEHAEGVRQERARSVPAVAQAEESLALARVELARVRGLSETLELTRSFLTRAQETVHRDIAPVLAGSLQSRLPQVTGGRYHGAVVDPATLQVQVRPRSGSLVPATGLSVGTAEQVYLLLRMALAEHLGDAEEPCPLLLDDVTVQSDEVRTEALLDSLLVIAEERQVVLFAQDEQVARWAKEHIGDLGQHRIAELAQVATP